MGTVYRALDAATGEPVALKVLSAEGSLRDETLRERFLALPDNARTLTRAREVLGD